MRLPLLIVIVAVLVNIVVDWYIYKAIKKRAKSKLIGNIHLGVAVAMLLYIVVGISLPRRSGSDESLMSIMWIIYSYFTVYLPKWFYVVFDLIASIPVLLRKKRLKIVSLVGGVVAVVVFCLLWWGALVNRYNIEVNEVEVAVDNLPDKFDGYRIAQFSDLHVGSYNTDTTFVSKLVKEINTQNVDAVMFTGDIVNRRTDELRPFVNVLSKINAPDGVFSILGNHDYGDYCNWESPKAKSDNLESLLRMQKEMGWRLLLNETGYLNRDNDSIAIVGVENWGDPPFSVYGDLNKAYHNLSDSTIKILLAHNPAHWNAEVANRDSVNIALTLSGHTHAMQMSLFGLSPSVWRYKTWGGRYEDNKQKVLYVNIGVGTVGIPTRIGATPEVTVFTLRKAI